MQKWLVDHRLLVKVCIDKFLKAKTDGIANDIDVKQTMYAFLTAIWNSSMYYLKMINKSKRTIEIHNHKWLCCSGLFSNSISNRSLKSIAISTITTSIGRRNRDCQPSLSININARWKVPPLPKKTSDAIVTDVLTRCFYLFQVQTKITMVS